MEKNSFFAGIFPKSSNFCFLKKTRFSRNFSKFQFFFLKKTMFFVEFFPNPNCFLMRVFSGVSCLFREISLSQAIFGEGNRTGESDVFAKFLISIFHEYILGFATKHTAPINVLWAFPNKQKV